MRFSKLYLFAAFAVTACVAHPKPGSANSKVITAEEISAANVPTAYDVVDRLHRSWFHDMMAQNNAEVVVYMNNQRLDGGKEALRNIPAGDVEKLEYLRGTDAQLRYGQDVMGGAIIVTRK